MESEESLLLTWLSIICIVGLPSNILVLIVYGRQPRITQTKRLIIALAISDIFGCIALLLQLSLIAASLGRSRVYCFSSVFSTSLTGTFSNFCEAYITIYQYKNCLYLNSVARIQRGKKDVILYIIFGLGALIVSLPSLFLPYSGTNNKCFYSAKLLLLISITRASITLCCMIVIIVYGTKIFSVTRKRQLIVQPAPNEQENHPALTVQNISQSVPYQQTISLTDLNKLFLASELAEGTLKQSKKNCYLQHRTTKAWSDDNDEDTAFQDNISIQGLTNEANPTVEITRPENTLKVNTSLVEHQAANLPRQVDITDISIASSSRESQQANTLTLNTSLDEHQAANLPGQVDLTDILIAPFSRESQWTNTLQIESEDLHNSKDGISKPSSAPFGATVEQNQPNVNLHAAVEPHQPIVNTCPAVEPHNAIVNPGLQQDDNIPKGPSHNRSSKVLGHVAKMLLLISVIMVLSSIPSLIVGVFWSKLFEPLQDSRPGLYLFGFLLRRFSLINYAINPVVYCLVNPSFRKSCAQKFSFII